MVMSGRVPPIDCGRQPICEEYMMRSKARWLAPIVALGVAVAMVMTSIGPASAESNGGVRVMPLGDSITNGETTPGGYRINLWQRVVNGGYTVDFVGSQSNGPA